MGAIPVSTPPFLLPFTSTPPEQWTEEQFGLFAQVQVAVGEYKEKSAEEIETLEHVEDIEKTMAEGGDWLAKLREFTGDSGYIETMADNPDYAEQAGDDMEEELKRLNPNLQF